MIFCFFQRGFLCFGVSLAYTSCDTDRYGLATRHEDEKEEAGSRRRMAGLVLPHFFLSWQESCLARTGARRAHQSFERIQLSSVVTPRHHCRFLLHVIAGLQRSVVIERWSAAIWACSEDDSKRLSSTWATRIVESFLRLQTMASSKICCPVKFPLLACVNSPSRPVQLARRPPVT